MINRIYCLLVLFLVQISLAQGSGDTNISMYGNVAPHLDRKENYFSVATYFRFDNGKNDVFSIAPYICLSTDVNEQLDFQLWLTSKYASGDLVDGFSIGDVSFIGTYHFTNSFLKDEKDQTIDFGLISSISGGKGLKKDFNNSYAAYPMEYQSTLGTIDLFLGYTFKNRKINFSLGYQQPLTSKNQNNFYPRYFELGDFNTNYPPSNEMKRSGNIYSRVGYNVLDESDLIFNVGATTFYKFKNDQFYDANTYPYGYELGYNEVNDTKGLALNGVLQFNYRFSKNAEVSIYAGVPLIERTEYIDGLSRSFFVTPGFLWNF